MINNIILFIKYWLLLELINWFTYLFIYIKITSPKFMYYKQKDTDSIINRIDKLSKDELEYVLKGCIVYDKISHCNIESEINLQLLSLIEIKNLIGYSLFGIEINDIDSSNKNLLIQILINKIEDKLNYKFQNNKTNKYLYRKWGTNFIKFSFRPLILQLPIRIIIFLVHNWFIYKLNFTYKLINKIGFLYSLSDPNKETIVFIHGLGFGYIPYLQLLIELREKYNLIIIILPNISSYSYYDDINYAYFPPLQLLNDVIYNFIESKNLNNIILLSHSFGTYITQILRKDSRNVLFKKIIMVDPIIFWIGCFKMSLHVDNPLIRKFPIHHYLADNILNFLIYQCIYLKYVCYRVMFGPDFWIYDAKELTNTNITIILEKCDYIIPAELLYNKIKNDSKCYYFDSDDVSHGTVLMDKKYLPDILEIINN